VLLTRDSLYSRTFLDAFMKQADVDVVGVALSTCYLFRGKHPLLDLLGFVRRAGFGYALYQLWAGYILPALSSRPAFTALCQTRGIPLLRTRDINAPESLSWLHGRHADFLLSFHFNQKLLPGALTAAHQAAINFHPACLPSLGGVDPVFFRIASGEGKLGASLHLVADNMDAGDILKQRCDTEPPDGLIATNLRLFELGGALAATVLKAFAKYNDERLPQDMSDQTYFGWNDVRKSGVWRTFFRALK